MGFQFAHLADIHLGKQQYGLVERFEDFGRAWLEAVAQICRAEVAFVVLAGDLFDKRNTDPQAFIQAQQGLLQLKDANIPVIAIEGNHDRYIRHREHSWMRVLAQEQLLILLDAIGPDGKMEHGAYTSKWQRGSHIDLPCGARIIGERYRGYRLSQDLRALQRHLKEQEQAAQAPYTIFTCHTGVQVQTEYPAGHGYVHLPSLKKLQPHVNYIAIGHIHYAQQWEGLIYQPGSLENCSSDEAKRPHGYYIVDVERGDAGWQHRTTLHEVKRRDYHLLSFDVTGWSDAETLEQGFGAEMRRAAESRSKRDEQPLVEITLQGQLDFPKYTLSQQRLEQLVFKHFTPLHTKLRFDLTTPEHVVYDVETAQSREALEREVLLDLYEQDGMGPAQAQEWAQSTIELKELALAQADHQSIFALLDGMIETLAFTSASEANAQPTAHEETQAVLEQAVQREQSLQQRSRPKRHRSKRPRAAVLPTPQAQPQSSTTLTDKGTIDVA